MADNNIHSKTAFLKAMDYLAAGLGIGTFLGFVNLAVGLLSAIWLFIQLYGYVRYELPLKRHKYFAIKEQHRKFLEERESKAES